jgi:hypothetical protein
MRVTLVITIVKFVTAWVKFKERVKQFTPPTFEDLETLLL